MRLTILGLTAALLAGVCAGCAMQQDAMPEAMTANAMAPGDAAKNICLRSDRFWSFSVINTRTLDITDIYSNHFTVRTTGGCVGLNNAISSLILRTRTRLGCMQQGDRVAFIEPTLGPMSCTVTAVELASANPKMNF